MERELGKILGKLEGIENEMQDAKAARKLLYERLETTDGKVDRLSWRMDALETALNKQAPTIAEFLTYKEQVRGAGRLGKFLWFIGGLLLSAAVTVSGWFHFTK